jgi:hypothetical protein
VNSPESPEILVIAASRPWPCASCGTQFERGDLLTMDDAGPLCLDCADLGHLEFLPRGNTALTRRGRVRHEVDDLVDAWRSDGTASTR